MGIPRLIQTLEPFAERVILGESDSADQTSNKNTSPPLHRVTSVVIDGPSLVYHIYYCLLSLKASQKNRLQSSKAFASSTPSHPHLFPSQPTYLEINQAVLSFITHLQLGHGVEVEKIYFDGALPNSKRDVRLARLEDGRRKLVELRRLQGGLAFRGDHERSASTAVSNHSSLPSSYNSEDMQEVEVVYTPKIDQEALFQPRAALPARFKAIPAPPFMVPSVIEYLQSELNPPMSMSISTSSSPIPSTHLNRQTSLAGPAVDIEIVPGEADVYCARHVKKSNSGTAVLTSDSDLLAYSLGSEGSVILLNSLEISTQSLSSSSEEEEGTGRTQVLGTRYHARSLASKLGISCSLQRFCFHRSLDATMGTAELKLRCGPLSLQLGPDREQEWKKFLQQYSTDDVGYQIEDEQAMVEEKSEYVMRARKISPLYLQGLDPRVAELITQFQNLNPHSSEAGIRNGRSEADDDCSEKECIMQIYLPVLLEDPSRDSAWSYGRWIRQLAYTMLKQYMLSSIAGASRLRLTVKEWHRRGPRIVGLPVNTHISSHQQHAQIDSLLQSYHSHQHSIRATEAAMASPSSASISNFWKSFALSQVSEQRNLDGKAPPGTAWAKRYLGRQVAPYTPISWDDVHDQASVEAVLYSMRILKQIAWLCLAIGASSTDEGEDGETVRALADALGGMPSIAAVMAAEVLVGERGGQCRSSCPNIDWESQGQGDSQVKSAQVSSSPMENASQRISHHAKRQRRSSERAQRRGNKKVINKGPATVQRTSAANMFAVLEEESE